MFPKELVPSALLLAILSSEIKSDTVLENTHHTQFGLFGLTEKPSSKKGYFSKNYTSRILEALSTLKYKAISKNA
jgi:hypothetical protein